MKCLHVNFKLYSKCVATTVLVTATVAMKAVLYSVYLRRGDLLDSRALVTVLCNRNGLASYNVCVCVCASGGAPVVHNGQKTLKGNKDDY